MLEEQKWGEEPDAEALQQLHVLKNAWHVAAHDSGAAGEAVLAKAQPYRALDTLPCALTYTALVSPDVHHRRRYANCNINAFGQEAEVIQESA